MTRQQQENLEELWSNLRELAGDIIAIQNFMNCKGDCMEDFGVEMCRAYLQRMGAYTDQHTQEIREIKDLLLIPELRELYSE